METIFNNNVLSRPTAVLMITLEDDKKPLMVDLRLGGIPEIRVLKALQWAANSLSRDIYNRAVVACGTNDIPVVLDYLRTKEQLEDADIQDILGTI